MTARFSVVSEYLWSLTLTASPLERGQLISLWYGQYPLCLPRSLLSDSLAITSLYLYLQETDCAMLRVIKYFVKSLNVIRNNILENGVSPCL